MRVTSAPTPPDESTRIAQLRSLGLLDSDPDDRFDRVTRIAMRLFDVPVALVTLVDEDRQWFKSRQGIDVSETPREVSFCAHAILGDGVMHVPDATLDVRFSDNPLVNGKPEIRFYAGCPIAGPDGAKLGTLCIIGPEPRGFTEDEARSLRDLAQMVEREIATLQLATRDDLTGLSNRRGFDLQAATVIEVCRRRNIPVTLLYLDLDGLKQINDRFGHGEGDDALREFAIQLQHTFRTSDVIARMGGDEFAVLLTGATHVSHTIGRLRGALAARNLAAGAAYPLTTSIGSATLKPDGGESLEQLVRRADAVMYADKESNARPHAAE